VRPGSAHSAGAPRAWRLSAPELSATSHVSGVVRLPETSFFHTLACVWSLGLASRRRAHPAA
jgi:hypothetical protein